jgi:HK97 family phage prohead protease
MREREFASFPMELARVASEGRTIRGYASVFNYPIDSGTTHHSQTTFVRPGAFTKTLQENRDRVQVLVNHGMDARWGMSPVAVVREMEQDAHGLRIAADIIDHPEFDPIVASLKAGALRAMSIQFETVKESFSDDRTERNLDEVSLWEFGPVTFPANAAATASLHSLNEFTNAQAEPLKDESRESTLDLSRLTWVRKAGRTLEQNDEALEAMAVRLSKLKE